VPKILLAGQDIHLLGTRAAVLAKTGADVISCMGSKAVGMVKSERPDLLVLCHSLLSGNDAHSIADEIRACCKTTKILMVVSELESDLPVQDAKFDAICSSNPERLIVHANELLGVTLPLPTLAVKRNGASTGKSGLNEDYRM
jgi:CheY-like chemotaxis protein